MATKILLTVEEFLRLPEPMDERQELVEGELVRMSPTMPIHNVIRDGLLMLLKAFLKGKDLGTVLSEQAFILSEDTVRIPDIAFVSKGRVIDLGKLPEGAPDLAIEVISPSNTPHELDQRVSDFFAAGCRRVWLVYPEHQEIYIHGLGGVTRCADDDLLEEPEFLPGFSVQVSKVFE